jgi:hypothetical protein
MWIIPKPLHTSLFAPDMAALISDSDELSELYEQSLMWRSKPSPSRTWSRRLSKDSWILALSTQTLKPCRGSSIVEKWTSSQVASLASHLALQGDEQEMKIHDTSGRTSSEASHGQTFRYFLRERRRNTQERAQRRALERPRRNACSAPYPSRDGTLGL